MNLMHAITASTSETTNRRQEEGLGISITTQVQPVKLYQTHRSLMYNEMLDTHHPCPCH